MPVARSVEWMINYDICVYFSRDSFLFLNVAVTGLHGFRKIIYIIYNFIIYIILLSCTEYLFMEAVMEVAEVVKIN